MRQYFSGERSIFSGERYTERKYRPISETVNYTDRNYMNSGRKFSYLTNTYRSCIIWESWHAECSIFASNIRSTNQHHNLPTKRKVWMYYVFCSDPADPQESHHWQIVRMRCNVTGDCSHIRSCRRHQSRKVYSNYQTAAEKPRHRTDAGRQILYYISISTKQHVQAGMSLF